LPIEQSHDDALSTTFDTDPLGEPLEIVGEPELTLHVAADRPVAKVFARLCEVRPDGKSWLVTWAALNLTRRESMSEPSPLQPGLLYKVTLRLRAMAHVFPAGSRVRLAISEGLWPMLWPSPGTPALSLPTGVSTLSLPVRSPRHAEAAFDMAQQAGTEPAPDYLPATPDAAGRIVLDNNTPAFPNRVEAAGVDMSASGEETSEITAGDPLSARWRHTSRSSWRSEGRDCAVEASYELTSDASSFRIRETLRATENGQDVFARESDTRIPRDLM
jgi:hypothetical protein